MSEAGDGSSRDTRRKPRVLLLTEFFPFDRARNVFGAFQRLHRHIDALAELGRLDVVFLIGKALVPAAQASLHLVGEHWPIAGEVHVVATGMRRRPRDWVGDAVWAARGAFGFPDGRASMATSGRRQARALEELLDRLRPQLIFAHRIEAAAPLIRLRRSLPPIVIDIDDIEHVKIERAAQAAPKAAQQWSIWLNARLARHAERQIGKRAALLLVASNLDRRKLGALCRGASIATIPNTVTAPALPPANARTALFVGHANYPPNREAIFWLANEIWPLVQSEVPEARLTIVGEGSDRFGVSTDGVSCVGFAEDLEPFYASARLAVCPIRRGGGTRLKILEAASRARAVVSTEVGAEGLAFERGSEIVIADDAQSFAEACVKLLRDRERAETIGRRARRRVECDYSTAKIAERLRLLCAEAIETGHVRQDGKTPLFHPTANEEIGVDG